MTRSATSSLADPKPYDRPASDLPAKKLPACDSCKLRHVLCLPVAAPGSCPACLEKGIVCSTTPVVRKKRAPRTGARIERAKATFGALESVTTSAGSPEEYAVTLVQPPSQFNPDAHLTQSMLRGELILHLLTLFQAVPQYNFPIYNQCGLVEQFNAAGQRMECMRPQAQVLARTVIAVTSRVSSHPLLLGTGLQHDPLSSTDAMLHGTDFQSYGLRRNEVCRTLRQDAIRTAWESGALAEPTIENAMTCNLLDLLECLGSDPPKVSRSYASAFVSHTRAIFQDTEASDPRFGSNTIVWSSFVMLEALSALLKQQTVLFTTNDDLDFCGASPPDLNDCLPSDEEDIDIHDIGKHVFWPLEAIHKHIIRMARECSDKLVGSRARRQPLDRACLSTYLDRVDQLHSVLLKFLSMIRFFRSSSTAALLAYSPKRESQRQTHMSICYYTTPLTWCALILPVYKELDRRSQISSAVDATDELERRKMENQTLLFEQCRRMAIKASKLVADCMQELPSAAYLTHAPFVRLHDWTEILLEAETSENPRDGLTRAEKIIALERLLSGLKIMGWSWVDDTNLVDSVERKLQQLRIEDVFSLSSFPLDLTSSVNWDSALPSINYSNPHFLGSPSAPYDFSNVLPAPFV